MPILLEPTVIYEDEALLVLNKPPGVVINRANSVKVSTMQDWVEEYLAGDSAYQASRQKDEVFAQRSGMVHRLDKDTSGVLLWAKQPAAMYELMRQFKAREVQKTYLTLVHGLVEPDEGIIKVGIERHPRDRERFSVSAQGRLSETHFQVRERFTGFTPEALATLELPPQRQWRHLYQGFSLVACQPKTGRTHQIRVHLQFIHHPLVSDWRYAGRKRGRIDSIWCPRQWLHAQDITLTHPVSGEAMTFTAPLAGDLAETLKLLA